MVQDHLQFITLQRELLQLLGATGFHSLLNLSRLPLLLLITGSNLQLEGSQWRNHILQANEYFCINALVAELYAIRDACVLFNNVRISKVIFESDSLNTLLSSSLDGAAVCGWNSSILVSLPKVEVQILLPGC